MTTPKRSPLWPFVAYSGRPPEARTHTVVHTINETIDASEFERWRMGSEYRPRNLADWAEVHKVKIEDLTGSRLAAAPTKPAPD